MTRKLRVSIDYGLCTGVGACEQVCPEVFMMNVEGLPDVLEREPDALDGIVSGVRPRTGRRGSSPV